MSDGRYTSHLKSEEFRGIHGVPEVFARASRRGNPSPIVESPLDSSGARGCCTSSAPECGLSQASPIGSGIIRNGCAGGIGRGNVTVGVESRPFPSLLSPSDSRNRGPRGMASAPVKNRFGRTRGIVMAFTTIHPALEMTTVPLSAVDNHPLRRSRRPPSAHVRSAPTDGRRPCWNRAREELADTQCGPRVRSFRGPTHRTTGDAACQSIAFSPYGRLLVASNADVLYVWQITTGQKLLHLPAKDRLTNWAGSRSSPQGTSSTPTSVSAKPP